MADCDDNGWINCLFGKGERWVNEAKDCLLALLLIGDGWMEWLVISEIRCWKDQRWKRAEGRTDGEEDSWWKEAATEWRRRSRQQSISQPTITINNTTQSCPRWMDGWIVEEATIWFVWNVRSGGDGMWWRQQQTTYIGQKQGEEKKVRKRGKCVVGIVNNG